MQFALVLALVLVTRISFAQTNAPATTAPAATTPKPVKLSHAAMTAAELQKAVDQLTQSNRDLLGLLKQQQSVLEDMQFDRRLQSRQIASLEERLESTLYDNTQLEKKISTLEADAAVHPIALAQPTPSAPTPTVPAPTTTPQATVPDASTNVPSSAPVATEAATPKPPSTYLPAPQPEGVLGAMSWHRLFTLKGTDNRESDPFLVQGRTWRVLWHNQDPDGKVYQNTSALFINAFPKGDTIPQKVCSKLGSGGDTTELNGPGNYYLRIEASGGTWEAAVEDFH